MVNASGAVCNDLWLMDTTNIFLNNEVAWYPVFTSTNITARSKHAMVFTPSAQLLLHGGTISSATCGSSMLSDAWTMDLSAFVISYRTTSSAMLLQWNPIGNIVFPSICGHQIFWVPGNILVIAGSVGESLFPADDQLNCSL